jgi:hypothetical protein
MGANFWVWVKKVPSLCLVLSRATVPHTPLSGRAVVEWVSVTGLLVMGGQGSGAFSIGICWFCNFLAISGLCGLTSSKQKARRVASPSSVEFFF